MGERLEAEVSSEAAVSAQACAAESWGGGLRGKRVCRKRVPRACVTGTRWGCIHTAARKAFPRIPNAWAAD